MKKLETTFAKKQAHLISVHSYDIHTIELFINWKQISLKLIDPNYDYLMSIFIITIKLMSITKERNQDEEETRIS